MFILFSITIFLLFIYGAHFEKNGNNQYLGKEQANAIKGFFILFLTVGHIISVLFRNGLYPSGLGNGIEREIHLLVGQLVVVMFLFFSGYGVSESILKDNDGSRGYLKSFPKKRILKTWLNYAVGIAIFLILSPVTGKEMVWKDIPMYFLAQQSIGAPTWYIFIIIVCYALTWTTASIFKKSRFWCVASLTVSLSFVALVLVFFKEVYWYNTILSYAFGFFYSQYKPELESFLKRHWLISFIITIFCFFIFYELQKVTPQLISYNLLSLTFALFFVLLSMKVKFGNKAVNWCGSHLFPIYMYQGIFFHSLMNIGGGIFPTWSPFLYALSSVVLTLVIAKYYHYWKIKMK